MKGTWFYHSACLFVLLGSGVTIYVARTAGEEYLTSYQTNPQAAQRSLTNLLTEINRLCILFRSHFHRMIIIAM